MMRVICKAVCVGLVLALTATWAAGETTQISRIEWCIHAYCWSLYGPTPPKDSDPALWHVRYSREMRIHEERMEAISNMKPDEALVIYPIGNPAPQRQLIEHAKRVLGPRCVVITRKTAGDEVFAGVKDPIRKFLNDPDWPERDAWIKNMLTDFGKRPEPPGIAAEMEAEVREACASIGHDWAPTGLEIAYYQRMIAYDIKEAFAAADLAFDPATVECVASGEGFEECSMSWKSMVGHYLGLENPIENDYERSISGEPRLTHATFKERVALSNDVRVFLWTNADGRHVALFARAGARLKDPQHYARFSMSSTKGGRTFHLESWSSFKNLFWESDSHTRVPAVTATVAVFNATRHSPNDGFFYLVGSGEPFEEFRDRMAAAEITTKPD